ncbi:hypothetical protein ACQP2P_16230 [Dactylosporangium sp. CA-139114]|uniref:hypothetical protein n=1 Tax=Dactylosporangium sp. CA-139114 TaxID=3239931 RepID=UPI003D99BC50
MTPEDLIAEYARISKRFQQRIASPDEAGTWFSLATNASWLGGYSETCVGVLFTRPTLTTYDSWWYAASWKTAGMSKEMQQINRVAAGWMDRLDDVDLFIPGDSFQHGRWRMGFDDSQLTPGLRALLAADQETLTCQVKARVEWALNGRDDAIAYSYFVDLEDAAALSRAAFLSDPPWKRPAVDLFALMKWKISPNPDAHGAVTPHVRLLGRDDARAAILDRERAYGASSKTGYAWKSRKVDFDHAFGKRAPQLPAVGLDLTHALGAVPRPQLP